MAQLRRRGRAAGKGSLTSIGSGRVATSGGTARHKIGVTIERPKEQRPQSKLNQLEIGCERWVTCDRRPFNSAALPPPTVLRTAGFGCIGPASASTFIP